MKRQFQHIIKSLVKRLVPPFPHSPLLPLSLSLLLLSSCSDPLPEKIDYNEGSGVFICNEGNMTFGNATLSFYDPSIETVKNQVFVNTNEFPVGDVLQSMTIIESLGYLMINNSGKIFVINTQTMLHKATIPGLTSPRYMLPIGNNTAYISDLYSDHLTMINTQTNSISGTIDLNSSSEQMVIIGKQAYVCSWSFSNKVFRIETTSHTVSDSLEVAMQPNSIVVDKNDKIWILSDGGYPGMPGAEAPALTCIDPQTFTIKEVFSFGDMLSSPGELTINPAGDTLYYIFNSPENKGISNGVYAHPIEADALTRTPFIPSDGRLFYGLACDPKSGAIYVSDAIDHIQKGWVFRYTSGAGVIDSFKVDIIPGAFCFKGD